MARAYTPESVYDGTFFTSDGSRQVVPFLHSVEESYFELAGAEGFVRPYAGERYVFAGLLPAEGTTPEELLQALDGATLLNALCEPQAKKVYTRMPKFTASTTRRCGPCLRPWACRRPLRMRRISPCCPIRP